jgi:hypothetical protein
MPDDKVQPVKKTRPKTSLELHKMMTEHGVRACGCSIEKNPKFCPYQEFIDGFSFVPDVGNGQTRGEIFTPRFVVDYMIIENGILPREGVYDLQYTHEISEDSEVAVEWNQDRLRKFVGGRVFEPAVGSGNYSATILWHKLEFANALALQDLENYDKDDEKYEEQLRRYQTYTLVAVASMYFNDIDVGNLQTTKWRLFRDGAIYSTKNVNFWVEYLKEHMDSSLLEEVGLAEDDLKSVVTSSLLKANDSWSASDSNGGVLDTLYRKHTGDNPPEWLKSSWSMILDHNGKLFNGIVEEDAAEKDPDNVENSFIVPGYRHVSWDFWWFADLKTLVRVSKRQVPLYRQIKMSEITEIQSRGTKVEDALIPDSSGFEDYHFENKLDAKKYRQLIGELEQAEAEVKNNKGYKEIDTFDIPRKDIVDSFTKLSKPSRF